MDEAKIVLYFAQMTVAFSALPKLEMLYILEKNSTIRVLNTSPFVK